MNKCLKFLDLQIFEFLLESFARFFHAAGNFLQDFVFFGNNLLSEVSMQDPWIFHVFQKVGMHAWLKHASFAKKVD